MDNAKVRALVVVRGQQCCGYCLSWRIEWAEFEVVRYQDHEGEKFVHHPGYLCSDCKQVSEPAGGPLPDSYDSPSPWSVPMPPALSGPTTW